MKVSVETYKIVPASKADPEALAVFYDQFFKDRRFPLKQTWQWQNRSLSSNNTTPLVMLDGEKVIAHAGIIPFQLQFEDTIYSASWYIDFMVHDAYRRKGLGLKITQAFTELSDIYFAVTGNEKSMGAFRKLGWAESADSFIHYIPIRPFNHHSLVKRIPRIFRLILNTLLFPLAYLNLRRLRAQNPFSIEVIDEETLSKLKLPNSPTNRWTPVRSHSYWRWRLLESPDYSSYRKFSIDQEKYILFKDCQVGEAKLLEVLFIPIQLSSSEQIKLIGALSFWAAGHDYSFVRLYTTIPDLSTKLKRTFKSFVTHPEFAYKASNKNLFEQIQQTASWNFQFIDNDFEVL